MRTCACGYTLERHQAGTAATTGATAARATSAPTRSTKAASTTSTRSCLAEHLAERESGRPRRDAPTTGARH